MLDVGHGIPSRKRAREVAGQPKRVEHEQARDNVVRPIGHDPGAILLVEMRALSHIFPRSCDFVVDFVRELSDIADTNSGHTAS